MTKWSVLRVTILSLASLAGVTIVASAVLLYTGADIPEGFVAIASAAVGALATMLNAVGLRNGDAEKPH